MTLIAVLLQTRSVGLRDRSLSSDRRPVWRIRLSEPSPFSFIDVRHHGFPTCSGQPCGHMNTPEAQTVVPVIRAHRAANRCRLRRTQTFIEGPLLTPSETFAWPRFRACFRNRKSVVWGKRVSDSVVPGGSRIHKNKKKTKILR